MQTTKKQYNYSQNTLSLVKTRVPIVGHTFWSTGITFLFVKLNPKEVQGSNHAKKAVNISLVMQF